MVATTKDERSCVPPLRPEARSGEVRVFDLSQIRPHPRVLKDLNRPAKVPVIVGIGFRDIEVAGHDRVSRKVSIHAADLTRCEDLLGAV
jgi:hypothetical protein